MLCRNCPQGHQAVESTSLTLQTRSNRASIAVYLTTSQTFIRPALCSFLASTVFVVRLAGKNFTLHPVTGASAHLFDLVLRLVRRAVQKLHMEKVWSASKTRKSGTPSSSRKRTNISETATLWYKRRRAAVHGFRGVYGHRGAGGDRLSGRVGAASVQDVCGDTARRRRVPSAGAGEAARYGGRLTKPAHAASSRFSQRRMRA